MHALRELLFDFPQLRPHALADRPALYGEVPVPVFPADVRETQKAERLWLAFSFSFPVLLGKSSELDPARLDGGPNQTSSAVPEDLPENGLLLLGVGNLGRYHRHIARRSRLLARTSCARHPPRDRKRNADRYWQASAKSPTLAGYLSWFPTICLPP